MSSFLSSAIQQFEYYKSLGEKTFAQVPDDKLFWQYNAESNSIATIVKHLWGNMLSRWTDFLHSDGEKEWRNRESEFENDISTRAEMLEKWDAGWDCVFQALRALRPEDLERKVFIRNAGHTVTEAVNRQIAHYAYHVGQIVYLGRMIEGEQWMSLSIPKGNSAAFNAEKFSKPRY